MTTNQTRSPPQGGGGGSFGLTPGLVYMSCALNTAIALLTFCGNTLVLLSFVRSSKIRRSQTNYFIASLAVADLISGCVAAPLWSTVVAGRFASFAGPQPLYEAYNVFDVFSSVASIMHLMFISLERYFAIVWPILHHVSTATAYVVVMIVVWVISITASLVSVEASKKYHEKYIIFNSVLVFGVPLAIILFSYLSIVISTMRRSQVKSRRGMEREVKVAVTVFILVGLFVLTWCPFFAGALVVSHCRNCFPITAVLLLKCLHYSGSFCNPIVYAARIPDFRKAFSNLLPKRLAILLSGRVGESRDSPPSSRDRTCSAMSLGDGPAKTNRQKLTLLDDKTVALHVTRPSQESMGSQTTGASQDLSASLRNGTTSSSPLASYSGTNL